MIHKCISLIQSWASRIAEGSKTTEYRNWPTRYRGKVIICASAKKFSEEPDLPLGCTVCQVEIYDCVWDEDEDCYGWKLRNVKPVPQFPVKGIAWFL